jgi:hypothetical protein
MSIFGSIMSAIFGTPAAAAPATPVPAGSANVAAPVLPAAPATATRAGSAAQSPVDVAAVLDKLSRASKEKGLDWRKSIVDLMKLLDLDSSLKSRKKLAQELGFGGDEKDSAAMNVWLHRQVMRRLADNGGKVPDDLKD